MFIFFNKKDFNKGFTLIELLIVIAVLGVLALIVMFGFSDFREIAREETQKLNEHNEKTNEFVVGLFENDEGWDNSYADYFEWEEYNSIQLTDYKYDKAVEELGEEKANNPIIPKKIEEQEVVKLGEYMFFDGTTIQDDGYGIKSVEIPNSVTEIGNYAFQDNNLTSVKIPDSVTEISNYAFRFNELTSVEIPDSVTRIGASAFLSNSLETVEITDSITEINNDVFKSNKLTSVKIPNSVTEIGSGAFGSNELTSVEIPNSVTNIRGESFRNNELTEIIMPENIELNLSIHTDRDLMGDETYFKDYYNEQNKQAGTYVRDNPDSTDWNLE